MIDVSKWGVAEKVTFTHNVDMLRISYEANQATGNNAPRDNYDEGIKAGIRIANANFLRSIEKLEKLIKESEV